MIVGGSGDPARYAGVAERLARRWTVLSWARRGFAGSPLDGEPPDAAGRLAADVADAAALVEARDAAPAAVFGSSSGAIVGLELVARHPGLVRTAVVHEPPILDLLDDPDAWTARFAAVAATYRRDGHAAAMAEFGALVGMAVPAGPVPESARRNRAFWFAHEFRQYPALRLDLDALTAATIVPAAGAHGPLTTATTRLAARLGRPVADLPGGHDGYVTHPAAFADALAALL
jgi:acetyltransferase/esterase